MRTLVSFVLVAGAIFGFVGVAATQDAYHIPLPDDYAEECQSEGCDGEEVRELHASYQSECFEETCSLEEVRELAGSRDAINAMLADFQRRGWRVNPCDFIGTCAPMPGDNVASGDVFFSTLACNQEAVDRFWHDFDFDREDWDEGFGYEDPCNIDLPLARTFNALAMLSFFGTSMPEGSSNWLPWFYAFSSGAIDELDGRCGSGRPDCGAAATTRHGPFIDNWTQLKWPFFYGSDVPFRAGSIVHEARHADGVSHNGGSGCPRAASCDSSWGHSGANTFEVLYLWWVRAQGTGLTTGLRNRSQARGNAVLGGAFNNRPTNGEVLGAGTPNPGAPFSIP